MKMDLSNMDLKHIISSVITGILEEVWWNYIYRISRVILKDLTSQP